MHALLLVLYFKEKCISNSSFLFVLFCKYLLQFILQIFDPKTDYSVKVDSVEFRKAHHPHYTIEYRERPFGIEVRRKTTGYML